MRKNKKTRKHRRLKFIVIAIVIVIGILLWKENQETIVCIDAGHGGKDAGSVSVNGKRYEKDDNLNVVLKVKEKLEEQNVKVILTRKDDTYVSLEKRCQIANIRRTDYFVSIHRNSSQNGNGVEIWIDSQGNEEDKKLAESIMDELSQTEIQSNRGVKEGTSDNNGSDYFVNKNTKMPSCLIELGFISNAKDNQLLDENIDEYAEAIARGILENIE